MTMRAKTNIRKIFFITFFKSLIFAYVVERVFAESRGLTVLQMQYIIILFSVISFALEIPSGALADRWKKKYMLALGLAFCWLEFFISIFAYNFPVFCLAFAGAAVGGSLDSGTLDSLLYQSLQEMGRTEEFEKLTGYLKFMHYILIGVMGLVGGYVAHHFGMVTNYWMSLFGYPAAILLALSLDEPEVAEQQKETHLLQHIIESFRVILQNPSLRNVFIYRGLTGAILYEQFYEISSLTYTKLGIPLYLFGYIGLVMLCLGGLGAVLANRLKGVFPYERFFLAVLLISSIFTHLFSQSTHWWGLSYLIGAIVVLEMVGPLISGTIHNSIPDCYRATISSTESFIVNGFSVCVGVIFGAVADRFSIFAGFQSMAALLAVYAVVFYLGGRRRRS